MLAKVWPVKVDTVPGGVFTTMLLAAAAALFTVRMGVVPTCPSVVVRAIGPDCCMVSE